MRFGQLKRVVDVLTLALVAYQVYDLLKSEGVIGTSSQTQGYTDNAS